MDLLIQKKEQIDKDISDELQTEIEENNGNLNVNKLQEQLLKKANFGQGLMDCEGFKSFQTSVLSQFDTSDVGKVRSFLDSCIKIPNTDNTTNNLINSATSLKDLLQNFDENKDTVETKNEIKQLHEYYFKYKIEDLGKRMEMAKLDFLDNHDKEFEFNDLLTLKNKQF